VIQIHQDNSASLAKLEAMLQDDPAKHLYRLDRAVFTDEQLFELELKYIFEGNWVYLAHESQIPNVNDYLTVHIGRAARTACSTRWPTPAHTAVRCCAGTRRATSPVSPARSTAGPSATRASC
jgi:hypothetical protein